MVVLVFVYEVHINHTLEMGLFGDSLNSYLRKKC